MTEWLSVRCPNCGERVTVHQMYDPETGAWDIDYGTCECGHAIDEEDMAECEVEPDDGPDWSTGI